MPHARLALLALLLALCTAAGRPPADPAARLAALEKEYTAATVEHGKAYKQLIDGPKPDREKAKALSAAHTKAQVKRLAEALDLAEADPTGPVGLPALRFAADRAAVLGHKESIVRAAELAQKAHAKNPAVGPVADALGRRLYGTDEAAAAVGRFVDAVLADNPAADARGLAARAKAVAAVTAYRVAERDGRADAYKLLPPAEAAWDKVRTEFGEVARLGKPLAAEAEAEVAALRKLGLGSEAPELAGTDLTGKPLKLSEYRGKVVLVVFATDHILHANGLYAKLKAMADKRKGRPFAVVGVVSDPDAARPRAARDKHPWRTVADPPADGRQLFGPQARAWEVKGLPAQFVIDPEGLIRGKPGPFNFQKSEELVDQLLDEARTKRKK